jgi:arylsulfatase A-like enzyme
MGSHLQTAGYRTAYIGKWHLDGTDYFGTGLAPEGYYGDYWFDGRNYVDGLTVEERTLLRSGLGTAEAIRALPTFLDLAGLSGPLRWDGGERRPRPADGVLPDTYNYDTGARANWVPASPFRGSE